MESAEMKVGDQYNEMTTAVGRRAIVESTSAPAAKEKSIALKSGGPAASGHQTMCGRTKHSKFVSPRTRPAAMASPPLLFLL